MSHKHAPTLLRQNSSGQHDAELIIHAQWPSGPSRGSQGAQALASRGAAAAAAEVEEGAPPAVLLALKAPHPPAPLPHEVAAAAAAAEEELGMWEQAGTFVRMACWLGALFAGYGIQRGLCSAGLPYDCHHSSAADVYATLTALAFVGGALGWLVGATRAPRFAWLFAPRRLYVWALFVGVLPGYSAISNIPGLRASLRSTGSWTAAMMGLMIALAVVVGAALAFHVWLALRVPRSRSAATNGGVAACSAAALRWVKHWRSRRRRVSGASAAATAAGKSSAVALQGVVTLEAPPHAELALEGGGQSPLSPADSAVGWGGSDGVDGGSSGSGSSGAASVCDEVEAGDVAAGGGGTVMGGGWRRTLRVLRWRTLGVYLAPRLAILAYFGAWMAALPLSGAFTLHLHHYMVGWALASFAVFNHPLSGALLALSTAIFVQGVSAYGFDAMFAPAADSAGGCLPAASETGQMACVFWSKQAFNLTFCSDTPWIPWFDCGLAWPYASSAVNPSGPANLLHGSAGSPPAGPAGGGMPHSFSLTPPSSSG